MLSSCHKKELLKGPMWSGKQKIGNGWYCVSCLKIEYYEGLFAWEGWTMRPGTHGFGGYYLGKGITKAQKKALEDPTSPVFSQKVKSHGLERKSLLAQNAYVREPE